MNKQEVRCKIGTANLSQAKVGDEAIIECTGAGEDKVVVNPAQGDEIDALGVDQPLDVGPGTVTLNCDEDGKWVSSDPE